MGSEEAELRELWEKIHVGKKEWWRDGSTLIGKKALLKKDNRPITCMCSAFAPNEPIPRWRLIDGQGKTYDVVVEDAWNATKIADKKEEPVDMSLTMKSALQAAVNRRQAKASLKNAKLAAAAAAAPTFKLPISRPSFKPRSALASQKLTNLKRSSTFTSKIDGTFMANDARAGPFSIVKIVGQRELNGSMGLSKDQADAHFPETVKHFSANPGVQLRFEVWVPGEADYRELSVIAANRKTWMNSDKTKPFRCAGLQLQGIKAICKDNDLTLADTIELTRDVAGKLMLAGHKGAKPELLQSLSRNHKGFQVMEEALKLVGGELPKPPPGLAAQRPSTYGHPTPLPPAPQAAPPPPAHRPLSHAAPTWPAAAVRGAPGGPAAGSGAYAATVAGAREDRSVAAAVEACAMGGAGGGWGRQPGSCEGGVTDPRLMAAAAASFGGWRAQAAPVQAPVGAQMHWRGP